MEWVGLAVLGVVALGAGSVALSTLLLGAGPVPTSRRAREAMLALVPPDVTGEVHELGAGWGGLSVALADRFPRATVVAWERSPVPYLFCRLRQVLRPRPNLSFRLADVFSGSFAGAAGIACYLHVAAMARLGEKLKAELPAGAFVVSNTFGFRGWAPEEERVLDDLFRTHVYRFVKRA